MKWKTLLFGLFAFALFAPSSAMADPPAQVPVQGYLTDDDGVPLDEQTTVSVEIFDSESGGSSLHAEQLSVNPTAGSFTAHLGTNQPLDLSIFQESDNLWLELTVEGQVLSPRLRIATAPYAASAGFARDAAQVGGKSVDELEQPEWDDIQNKPDGFGETYTAGEGLDLDGNNEFSVDDTQIQSRISNPCPSGEFATGVNQDGSLMCSSPPMAGAGSGLNKSNGTLSVDATAIQSRVTGSCADDENMVAINQDGTVECRDDVTGVTAGAGLSGGGTSGDVTVDVAQDGIDASMLQTGSVGSDEISDGAVGNNDLANGSVDSGAIQTDAVGSNEIADGSIQDGDISGSASIDPTKVNGEAATLSGGADFSGNVTADDYVYSSSKQKYKTIPASAFQLNTNTESDGWYIQPGAGKGYLTDTSGNGVVYLVAPVDDVQEGAEMTDFYCYYTDDDGSNDLNMYGYLKRRRLTTAASDDYTNVASFTNESSSSSSSSLRSFSDTSFSETVSGQDTYWIRVRFNPDTDTSNLAFAGCKIYYDVDGPAP